MAPPATRRLERVLTYGNSPLRARAGGRPGEPISGDTTMAGFLAGKVVAITGGGRGIGRAVARPARPRAPRW